MRSTAIILIYVTSIFLVLFAALTQMEIPFGLIFYLMIAGQLLVAYMVYKVLTDTYSTDKTFDDWYEDHPREEG